MLENAYFMAWKTDVVVVVVAVTIACFAAVFGHASMVVHKEQYCVNAQSLDSFGPNVLQGEVPGCTCGHCSSHAFGDEMLISDHLCRAEIAGNLRSDMQSAPPVPPQGEAKFESLGFET
jgi:hypothetical protein